ncbi:hypothetical protein CBL_09114 [Carabus blaptoides fortunei]
MGNKSQVGLDLRLNVLAVSSKNHSGFKCDMMMSVLQAKKLSSAEVYTANPPTYPDDLVPEQKESSAFGKRRARSPSDEYTEILLTCEEQFLVKCLRCCCKRIQWCNRNFIVLHPSGIGAPVLLWHTNRRRIQTYCDTVRLSILSDVRCGGALAPQAVNRSTKHSQSVADLRAKNFVRFKAPSTRYSVHIQSALSFRRRDRKRNWLQRVRER